MTTLLYDMEVQSLVLKGILYKSIGLGPALP
jgi:hypothetical protein